MRYKARIKNIFPININPLSFQTLIYTSVQNKMAAIAMETKTIEKLQERISPAKEDSRGWYLKQFIAMMNRGISAEEFFAIETVVIETTKWCFFSVTMH